MRSVLASLVLLAPMAVLSAPAHAAEAPDDPFLWLEEVASEEALAWARDRNEATVAAVGADPGFEALRERLLAIYDSDERIPYPGVRGEHWYNFWRDGEHPKGVWRRTTAEAYRAGGDVDWDVLVDVDALAAEEGESWVWKGATCLPPAYERCLLSLSRGGADATVVRELDLPSRSFVEDGFVLPEAKSSVDWVDRDTVLVGTDFGEGSLTDSGYPRVVKRWRRGTPLSEAEVLFEGETADVAVGAGHDHTPGYERTVVYRSMTFYSNRVWVLHPKKGLEEVRKPDSANARIWRDHVLIELREDWEVAGRTWPAGSLLAAPYKTWMKGKDKGLVALFTPTETTSLAGYSTTRSHLVLNVLDDVKNRLSVLTPGRKAWDEAPLPITEDGILRVSASAQDDDHNDRLFLTVSGYTTPTTLMELDLAGPREPTTLRSLPAFFDAEGLEVTQHFAESADGTRVPYFQVAPADQDGPLPTLQYGYGGFEIALLPGYAASVGTAWLEKGGVYVVANIRGGGEYGPRWHQAALKDQRLRAYEDFAAVARDLVDRGVTTHDQLATRGGSNGGLLMGNMLTLYPELWGAIHCAVPLLDMRRFHTLLAGASWMGEYGNPDDPEQWSFMKAWSPYHNADPEGADYPPILFTTSTRDDRVHPGHARKMAALLLEGGEDDVLYYENIEGGHGGAADNAQRAFMDALAYTFLWETVTTGQAPAAPADGAGEPEE